MAIMIPSEAQVEALAVAYFQIAHRDPITGRSPPVGPRTFLGAQARALAQLIGETLAAVKGADDDAVPGTYTDAQGVVRTRNSTTALDNWAVALGLPSGVAGQFGRKGAQVAKGGGATATGTPGVSVASGAQLTDPSGQIILKLRTGVTIGGGGSASVIIDAVTTGVSGNLPVNTVLRWSSPPPGLAATLTLTSALLGGADVESDVALALRIVATLQNPPKGGTPTDFRVWTEAAEDGSGAPVGVMRAYVFPRRDGTGSVTVVPTMGGSGQDRKPTAAQKLQIQAWLDSLHIASDTAIVVLPIFVSGQELSLSVTVYAAPGYDFDWSDAVSATAVASGTSGSTSLVVAAAPPSSLTDAITNGNRPRIAINYAGNPIPFVSRVTAFDSGTNTLTLASPLPVTLVGGEEVLPAGGATLPVATALLAYVNSVGPSRQRGYSDPLDHWEDSVSIGRIAEVALSAQDSASGDLVCVWSPGVGTGVGATIAVGLGSPSGADFYMYDNVPGSGPQLPEAVKITVRRAGA
jgi:uncharacterized phage protein gp47/JayE